MPDIGVLLQELAGSPELRPFRELLDPLVVYDRERDSDLVRTLSVFFECSENVSEAADRLFLHRNSVPYRLARVEELIGLDLKDHRARLTLELGLLTLAQEKERSTDDED